MLSNRQNRLLELANTDERFKFSSILLCSVTRIIAESIRSFFSPLLAIIFYSLRWLMLAGLLDAPDQQQPVSTPTASRSSSTAHRGQSQGALMTEIKRLRAAVAALGATLERKSKSLGLTSEQTITSLIDKCFFLSAKLPQLECFLSIEMHQY